MSQIQKEDGELSAGESTVVRKKVLVARPQRLCGIGLWGILATLLVSFSVIAALGLQGEQARLLFVALFAATYLTAAFQPKSVGLAPTRTWPRYVYGVAAWTLTSLLVMQHAWLFAVISIIPSVRAVLLLNSHYLERLTFTRHQQKQRARSE